MYKDLYTYGDKLIAACAIAMLCSGCFKDKVEIGGDSGNQDPPPAQTNHAPTISGTPTTSLVVGQAYSFQPSASDADGDALTFSIQNQPSWAAFNPATGRLSGTPGAGDAGQFSNVRISVSDGAMQASLNSFTITVNQIAMGSVTLSWTPPTTNTDGSPLTDLAGYRIHYGTSATSLSTTIVLNNAGTTRFVVENLSPATWYFSLSSFNSAGVESTRTGVVSRTLT